MPSLVLQAYWKLIHFDLYLARENFAALYDRVRQYPIGNTSPLRGTTEKSLLRRGYGVHLVLERGALPAAISGYSLPAQALWHTSSDGHWSAADALQGPRLGRGRGRRSQRQALHAGNIRSARPMLGACPRG